MRSDSSFPLDAEQIVRLTGAVLTRVLNAIRHPDAKRVSEDELTLSLARSTGVAIATHGEGWDQRLAPYGPAVRTEPKTACDRPAPGGSHAA